VESFRVIFEVFRAQLNVLGPIEQRKKPPVRHTEALDDAQGDVAQQGEGTAHKYSQATESTGVYENSNPHNFFKTPYKNA
jgi:hypothetical protein